MQSKPEGHLLSKKLKESLGRRRGHAAFSVLSCVYGPKVSRGRNTAEEGCTFISASRVYSVCGRSREAGGDAEGSVRTHVRESGRGGGQEEEEEEFFFPLSLFLGEGKRRDVGKIRVGGGRGAGGGGRQGWVPLVVEEENMSGTFGKKDE